MPKPSAQGPDRQVQGGRKGVSYTFDHDGNTGSGAKSHHLVVFDRAVLRSTPLPFLTHGSAIIKTIAFAPVAEILAIYTATANLTSGAGKPGVFLLRRHQGLRNQSRRALSPSPGHPPRRRQRGTLRLHLEHRGRRRQRPPRPYSPRSASNPCGSSSSSAK